MEKQWIIDSLSQREVPMNEATYEWFLSVRTIPFPEIPMEVSKEMTAHAEGEKHDC
jgi:hypothetical protein